MREVEMRSRNMGMVLVVLDGDREVWMVEGDRLVIDDKVRIDWRGMGGADKDMLLYGDQPQLTNDE